ncbi:hypothetical protein SARC_07033 [Sphaeroforma arctica JP610]|uniref:tRNA-binding domain-containing protein n=1 Tax=Sphaeroforma arctica JP610 TaxID=667725 RepID=A0A0L0FUU6_9EUKA|nr:hypothetical protein SARC_07033 [Sphaeroforma arctica JP610]KNC80610.1 hypothetical protein SARC_07033 [Sphaeroforma arctica JP610]|eukprot:XP_014154512.1 hypothetical protein SARC_07033 [Sphaeroforma arctica JP610]
MKVDYARYPPPEKSLSGSNAEERAAITQWQSYTQTHVVPAAYKNDDATTSTVLKHVETALTESAFIATPEVSVADVVLGAALAPFSTKFESKTKAWFLNLTRCSKGAIQPVSAAAKDKGIAKSGKAEKDAKKAEKKKEKPPAEPEKDPLSLVDVRVGHITECKAHPDADSLYVETMELGEEAPRTIISGLVKFQSLEQMIGRKVLVVCNMKPVKMRGISSEGMVLCASNEDHSVVEPLTVPDGCKPGDLVSFEGYERCPVPQMPPKKKIFEAVQPKLHVIDGKALYAKKVAMTTEHGPITCEKIPNATIS